MSDDLPVCGHDVCAFERDCLRAQADAEFRDAVADHKHRRELGSALAHSLGLGDDEGRLLEVALYSPDPGCRVAAAGMLAGALERLGEGRAA